MEYNKQIISDLLRELESRRNQREQMLAERRKQVYARLPRIRQIDDALRGTAARILRAALDAGDDPSQAIEQLRHENLALQRERTRLLLDNGMSADFLDDKPDCPKCNDLGYIGSTPCQCLKAMYVKRLTQQLSSILPIDDQNFDTFRLDYYSDKADARIGLSPRENMVYNLGICKDYAHSFHKHSPNLLLFGSSGLGKTFLSTCIARTVSEKGFSVVYDTAIHVLSCYETVHFNSPGFLEARQAVRRFEGADLFILDDLGTELSSALAPSVFYSLVNTRLMSHKPMIVNTNLHPVHFETRYSAALSSRLQGDFSHLRFFGDDIRLLKKARM